MTPENICCYICYYYIRHRRCLTRKDKDFVENVIEIICDKNHQISVEDLTYHYPLFDDNRTIAHAFELLHKHEKEECDGINFFDFER